MGNVTYLRNFIFGVEDSLVSTVGLLSGIAVAGVPRETIFLTGIILIFVEAFSMGAGSFLSETSAEEYARGENAERKLPLVGGMVMFISYFVAGFIPLFPYLIAEREDALVFSIAFSVLTLLALGAFSGAFSKTRIVRGALRMATVGGIAIGVGIFVGSLIS